MKLKIIIFCSAALIVSSAFLRSQPVSVYGSLIDKISGLPVSNARIMLREIKKEALSNENGQFTFLSIPSGSYTLAVYHLAYKRVERIVRVHAGDTLHLLLDPVLFHSAEVIVQSTRENAYSQAQPIPVAVVDGSAFIETSAPTVSDALSREPGIALVRDGMWESLVSIRGMTRYNIVMMIDNIRIETANDHAAALSLLDPFDIDRVEVIKGASSALAGTGAFGGVVNIITKSPSFSDEPFIRGESMVRYESVNNSHAEHLALESGSDVYRFRTSGMFRRADNYASPEGVIPNSYFNDWDVSADAGVKIFGTHSFDFTYQRSQSDDAGIPGGSSLFPPTAMVRYTLARRELFKAEYTIPSISEYFSSLVIRASQQNIERNVQLIKNPDTVLTPHASHKTGTVQAEAVILPAEGHYVTTGFEVWDRQLSSGRESYFYNKNIMVESVPLPNSSFISAGAYMQDEWKLIPEKTSLVVGGRYDAIQVHNDMTLNPLYMINAQGIKIVPPTQIVLWPENTSNTQSWSANAGIQQTIAESLDASFLLSTAFRTPSLEELYAYLTNTTPPVVGNPNLQPEKSVSLDCVVHFHMENVSFKADIYYNTYRDLVGDTLGTFEGGSPAYLKANINDARIYGYELSLDAEPSDILKIRSWLSYTRGEDTKKSANLGQIAPIQFNIAADYLVQKIGTVNAECEIVGEKTNPAAGETSTGSYVLTNAGFTTASIEGFGLRFKLSAGIQNIFNRAYVNFLSTLRGNMNNEPGRNIFVSVSTNW
jgi:outer membrane receptor protein involved in Fe transport